MNTTEIRSLNFELLPPIEKVGGGALVLGGLAVSILAANSILVVSAAFPLAGVIIGIAMAILGAGLYFHARSKESPLPLRIDPPPEPTIESEPYYEDDLYDLDDYPYSYEDELAPLPAENVDQPLVDILEEPSQDVGLSSSDKTLAASNLLQWGLVGASLCGVAPAVTGAVGLAAGIGSSIHAYRNLPKDASLFRKVMTLPMIWQNIAEMHPVLSGISKVSSIYHRCMQVKESGSKLYRAWKGRQSSPREALKAGAVHLFNAVSGTAFAAHSLGVDQLVKKPKPAPVSEYCPYENPKCGHLKPHPSTYRKISIGSIYESDGNKDIKEIADLVDATHKEYAKRWGLTHTPIVTTRDYLRGKCTDPTTGDRADCSKYWPKIPAMMDWVDAHSSSGKEEQLLMVDYDGPITNMKLDPHLLVEKWRGKEGSSVIVTKDAEHWAPNAFRKDRVTPQHNMNGGFWVIDNSKRAKELLEAVWWHRNTVHDPKNPICKTWGMCENQDCLHEQQATIRVMLDDPSLIESGVLKVIPQRDPETGVGVNTSNRGGCLRRIQKGFHGGTHWFQKDEPGTEWQPGDLMGQPNGVPPVGQESPLPKYIYEGQRCNIDPSTPISRPRLDRIKDMISKTVYN